MSEPCIQVERITRHGMEIEGIEKDLEKHVKSFEKHIDTGRAWRMAVVGSCAVILVQIAMFFHYSGRITEMLDRHDKVIERIEKKVFP